MERENRLSVAFHCVGEGIPLLAPYARIQSTQARINLFSFFSALCIIDHFLIEEPRSGMRDNTVF